MTNRFEVMKSMKITPIDTILATAVQHTETYTVWAVHVYMLTDSSTLKICDSA